MDPPLPPSARLFGRDGHEIVDLDSWFVHAPPEKGIAQWRDGYSAKEQASAWLRSGRPTVPEELWSALGELAPDTDEIYGRPEHRTRLDDYRRARQHDLFACARRSGETVLVVGIEAKACENFDGTVADRAGAPESSNKRKRCNLLSRALFGREVFDESTDAVLDTGLSRHGYQLWTAAVGVVLEAQQRGVADAVLVVQQFAPRDLATARRAGDVRDWMSALRANTDAFEAFAAEIQACGSESRQTKYVKPGTRLHVMKVASPIEI